MRTSGTERLRDPYRRVRGFTLLELLVVLAIVALIASLTLPNMRLPGIATDASRAARQIAGGLAQARQTAIFSNRESRLVLDMENKSFVIDKGPPVRLTGVDKLSLLTAERDVLSQSSGTIRFFSDGSAGGGEITIQDLTGATATVRVNWLSGRIILDG